MFNASYLSRESSERGLAYLAHSDFQNGLVAGVPQGITVAHKFGERVSANGAKQLHDCGIVYYPTRPYLLCVMTRGDDFSKLTEVIQSVSRIVYQSVDEQRAE